MSNYTDLDLEVYIAECEDRILRGLLLHPPATVEQLTCAADNYPEHAAGFLPSAEDVRNIGLPATLGRCEAFPLEFREQFLTTLIDVPEFATAIRVALRPEAQQ